MSEEKLDTQIRREQIAEAALQLVASQGLRRLSVAAVARRVGLVPSGIYRHFRSKDEILSAVLERIEQRLLENVRAAQGKPPIRWNACTACSCATLNLSAKAGQFPASSFPTIFTAGNRSAKKRC